MRPPAPGARDPAVLALAALAVAGHLATIGRYGYFRDEFYYIACAGHLGAGYVDHPPLIGWITRAVLETIGASLPALRLLPALASGVVVWLAARIAGEMGGGRLARALAALCVLASPTYLFNMHVMTMNAFDILFWTLAAFLVVRAFNGAPARTWTLFGVVAGLGLLNKHSLLFFGAGIVAGMILSTQRRLFRTRGPWIGAGIAAALFAPHVVWQFAHGWPTLEFVRNATAEKNVALGPARFFAEQILGMNPAAFPIWAAGIVYLLVARAMRPYRAFGWAYLVVFALMMLRSAKPYYLTPVYPPLLAAGAVAVERVGAVAVGAVVGERAGARRLRRALPSVAVTVVAVGAVAVAPLTLPVLSPEGHIRYSRALGIQPRTGERMETGELPQYFADMFGWEELVATVAHVYEGLPPEERAHAAILGSNYGEAGAVSFLGDRYGLPDAISGHNSYFLWGPGGWTGEGPLITINFSEEEARETFEEVTLAAVSCCRRCMPYEDRTPILVCRGPKRPVTEIWPSVKEFI